MSSPIPPLQTLTTDLGLCLNTSFLVGSLTLSHLAIPALFLPSTAPLMPPLEYVSRQKASHFRADVLEPMPTKLDKQKVKGTGLGNKGLGKQEIERMPGGREQTPSEVGYLVRQWFFLFAKGMRTFPPLAVSAGTCYLFAAVTLPGEWGGLRRGLLGCAAVLSVGAMVFTLTVQRPINERMQNKVVDVLKMEGDRREGTWNGKELDLAKEKEETEKLIGRWGIMNAWRAMLPAAAGICAIAALVLPS